MDVTARSDAITLGRLERLYQAHAPEAARLAFLLTGDRRAAGEVAGQAFVRLAGRFWHLRDAEAFRLRLSRTVVALARRRCRRARLARAALRRRPSGSVAAPEHGDDVLASGPASVSFRRRAAVVLRCYLGLSEQEAAEVMGCSAGAVRSLVDRGIPALDHRAESVTLPPGHGSRMLARARRRLRRNAGLAAATLVVVVAGGLVAGSLARGGTERMVHRNEVPPDHFVGSGIEKGRGWRMFVRTWGEGAPCVMVLVGAGSSSPCSAITQARPLGYSVGYSDRLKRPYVVAVAPLGSTVALAPGSYASPAAPAPGVRHQEPLTYVGVLRSGRGLPARVAYIGFLGPRATFGYLFSWGPGGAPAGFLDMRVSSNPGTRTGVGWTMNGNVDPSEVFPVGSAAARVTLLTAAAVGDRVYTLTAAAVGSKTCLYLGTPLGASRCERGGPLFSSRAAPAMLAIRAGADDSVVAGVPGPGVARVTIGYGVHRDTLSLTGGPAGAAGRYFIEAVPSASGWVVTEDASGRVLGRTRF